MSEIYPKSGEYTSQSVSVECTPEGIIGLWISDMGEALNARLSIDEAKNIVQFLQDAIVSAERKVNAHK